MRTRDPNRVSLMLLTGTLIACIACALVSGFIAPELVSSAYYGGAGPVLNRMITGQASHSLLFYIVSWNVLAWRMQLILLLTGFLVTLVARPEFQNTFWGPEPAISTSGPEDDTIAREVSADPFTLPFCENLASSVQSRVISVLFGLVLALTFLLRLVSLGTKSFSEDEIFSVLLAREHWAVFWDKVAHSEANMVLYYAILRLWTHLGQSEFAIRSLSVVFALAAAVALYSLGTRAFGKQVSLVGALLFGINGFQIEYSQDARSYSLLLLLVTLSSLLFLESVREGSRRNWTRYIVVSALAIYAHIFAVLVLFAHWVFLLFVNRGRPPWRRFLASTAAIGILALPMEWFVLFGHHGQLSWVPHTTLRRVYNLFAGLAGNPDHVSPSSYGKALLLCVYLIPVLVAILAFAKSHARSMSQNEMWYVGFFLTWLSVPIFLSLAISMRSPVFVNRFLIICLPPFILLAAYGVSRLHRAWLVVGLLCAIAGLTAPRLLAFYQFPAHDWKAASEYLLSNRKPGDAVVFCPGYYESRLTYYLEQEQARPAEIWGRQRRVLPPYSERCPAVQDLPFEYDRVWFISHDELPKAMALQKSSIETSLAAEFPRIEGKRFPDGLVVVLCQK
jgi:mannosyltransferase